MDRDGVVEKDFYDDDDDADMILMMVMMTRKHMSARQMSVTQCAHLVTMGPLYQLELLHIIERCRRYYLERLRLRRVFHHRHIQKIPI